MVLNALIPTDRQVKQGEPIAGGACLVAVVAGTLPVMLPAWIIQGSPAAEQWPFSLYGHPATATVMAVALGGLAFASVLLLLSCYGWPEGGRAGLALGAVFGGAGGGFIAIMAIVLQVEAGSLIPDGFIGLEMGGAFLVGRVLPLAAGAVCGFTLFRRRYRDRER